MAGGTQAEMLNRANQALRQAQAYEDSCGRAQKGTPLGDDLPNAQRARAAAEQVAADAQRAYNAEMAKLR